MLVGECDLVRLGVSSVGACWFGGDVVCTSGRSTGLQVTAHLSSMIWVA